MSDDVLVKVDNVSKRFCRSLKRSLWYGLQDLGSEIGGRRHGGGSGLPQSSADVQLRPDEFWAVKDVSFELRRGECLGLIGRNGAGKTTLLRMLNGLIKPDTGRIEMRGSVGAMIALGAGFNPVLTGRENIMIATSLARLSYSQTRDAIDEILEFAELGQFVDSPVQTYSSGMQVRLGFAAASTIRPDILILDEVLSVGDAGFRMKCFNKVLSIREIASVIFVSHSMHQIHRICTQSVVLSSGKQLFEGDISSAIAQYQNLFVKNHEKFDHIPGCKIQQIRVDNSIDKVINTKPGVPLHIEIDFDCSFESMNAHAIVSLQEQSGEIIFQASNMESPDHLHLPKGEFTLSLVFTPPKMGSTDKFLSIQIRNGDDQKIIAFAHQAWTFRVLNDSYIHASTYDVLSACVKSHT